MIMHDKIPDPFRALEKRSPEEIIDDADNLWDFYGGLVKSTYRGICNLLSRMFQYTGDPAEKHRDQLMAEHEIRGDYHD